jgi:hypothetical protein
MIYNYNKHEILSLLESGRPNIFQELKSAMHDQINDGYQIKISNQIKGVAIEDEVMQWTMQEVDAWFKEYGF